jgi:hypothetical protein
MPKLITMISNTTEKQQSRLLDQVPTPNRKLLSFMQVPDSLAGRIPEADFLETASKQG